MAQTSGIVTEIKARSTRVGDMYDVIVNGVPYGNGKYAPRGVKAGDFVTFEFEEKQNGQYTNRNIIPKTLRVDDKPSNEAVSAAKSETRQVVAAQSKKDIAYSRGASLNTALALVNLKLQHGAVKLPAKAADANDVIDTLVAATAAKLYRITNGDEWDIDLSAEDVKRPASSDMVEGEYEA